MESTNSSLNSSDQRSEQKWVVEIDEILQHQLKSQHKFLLKTPSIISIFQVPKSLTTQKPEAFDPQLIGLGPIHHFHPIPYKNMQQKKLDVIQKVVKNHKIKDFKLTVLGNVQKLVPVVRSCYDIFLQDDNVSLAWIFAMDGLFLLDLLYTYISLLEDQKNTEIVIEEELVAPVCPLPINRRLLAQDIIMLQNQIPFMVLKEINKSLKTSLADDEDSSSSDDTNNNTNNKFSSLSMIFRPFSELHSPLELCKPSLAPHVHQQEHLLHYMYHSIVNNVSLEDDNVDDQEAVDNFLSVVKRWFCKVRLYYFPTRNRIANFSDYQQTLQQFPKEEIVQLYKKITSALETFTQKISGIPSASTLHARAGFTFHGLPKYQGITKIVIQGKRFHLPCVTLNIESDTTLRNLVAYEMLIDNNNAHPLIDYIGLMCELIVNVNDVKLLKEANIICTSDDDHDGVVKLFVEMKSFISSMKMKDKSKFQGDIEEVKKVYERKPLMMAYLAVKKVAEWLLAVLKAIGGFVESSWKIVVFMVSVVTVSMLMWQAYCANFGCDKTNYVTRIGF